MHAKTLHLSAPRLDGDKEDKVLGMRIWARLETCWTELRKLTASLGCRPLGVLELSKPWETKSRQAVSQSKRQLNSTSDGSQNQKHTVIKVISQTEKKWAPGN